MKTKKMKSRKVVSNVMLLTILIAVFSCNANNSKKEMVSKPVVPDVDIHTAAFMGNVEAIK